jgi:hypothetical protein
VKHIVAFVSAMVCVATVQAEQGDAEDRALIEQASREHSSVPTDKSGASTQRESGDASAERSVEPQNSVGQGYGNGPRVSCLRLAADRLKNMGEQSVCCL